MISPDALSMTDSAVSSLLLDDRLHQETLLVQPAAQTEQPLLQIPSDFLKTSSTVYQPAHYTVVLPGLDGWLAKQSGLDGRSLLLAAFNALLYRYTQQETVYHALLLHSSDGRERCAAKSCTQISSQLTVRELIDQVTAILNGLATQNDSLSELLQHQWIAQRSNLPIALSFVEQSCADDLQQGSIAQQALMADGSDIHLAIVQQQQTTTGVLTYNANLFKADTIERLAGHLHVLIEGMMHDLDCSIAQLPLLTEAETHQLLVDWSSARVDYPQVPIHHYIETHAVQQPHAVALRFQTQQLTYVELNQRANQLAWYLKRRGVETGDRVAVCVQPSLDIAVTVLGIFKAGATYVPLDPTHPIERLRTIAEDTQPKILLTQSDLLPSLPVIAHDTFCLDTDWHTLAQLPTQNLDQSVHLDQTAYLIYTSGTTGKPKGVMASHANLINYILVAQERFDFNRNDVMPAIARFTFSITMFELFSPLVAGGTLVILEREHILDFKRMVKTLEQLTFVHTSPSLMHKLIAYIKENDLDLQKFHGLRHVSCGGDMVSAELLESMKHTFENAEIFVIYGCSEISCMGCTYPVARNQTTTKSQVGKPFNNVSVRLYDAQQNLVPIGIPGEIYFGGAGITQGYLNREELTQEKFVTIDGQRFYRTGDLGRFDADGNLEILGRDDFQIKLRGIRIELGEIESALRQAEGVREGVVVARELGGSSQEKSLVAYVVLDRTHPPTIESIRQFLQIKLPDYMVPAGFVVLEAMPVNMNQKVDRKALPVPTLENLAGLQAIVAPRNDWEKQLTEIWEKVLGIQPIGVRNSFFELGGNSLLAVQILTEIEKVWGKTLPITALLHAPTIEELVTFMRDMGESGIADDLVPLRSSGSKPPLFCLYGVLIYQELVNHLDRDRPVYGVFLQEEVELVKTGKFDAENSVFSSVPSIAARYLQAIRALQPHGPYHFAGESFGGVIAFEMAQQLRAVGEEVALVALLDSWMLNTTKMSLSQRLKLHWKLMSQHRLAYLSRGIQQRTNKIQRKVSAKVNKVYQKLRPLTKHAPQTLNETTQQNIRDEVLLRAGRSYVPQPYSGKLLLFRAMERDVFEVSRRDMGWEPLAAGGLHIYDVPGDHVGILREPNVQVLAKHLQAHL